MQVLRHPSATEDWCRKNGFEGSKIMQHVRAGFDHNSEIVQCSLVRALRNECKRFFDEGNNSKFRISLPKSVYLPVIPDEYDLLLPGEVLVKINNCGNFVRRVLLARNPCYDPGELLLSQAVDVFTLLDRVHADPDDPEGADVSLERKKKEAWDWYSNQKTCIIMSVLGDRELGEMDKVSHTFDTFVGYVVYYPHVAKVDLFC